MTKSEIAELVKLCSYPELQKLWRPEAGDDTQYGVVIKVYPKPADLIQTLTVCALNKHNLIWLPRTDDAIRLMGDKFWRLIRITDGNFGWVCQGTQIRWTFSDDDARIACLRALKATLKGG